MAVAPLTLQLCQSDLLAVEYHMTAVTPLLYQGKAAVAPGIVVVA